MPITGFRDGLIVQRLALEEMEHVHALRHAILLASIGRDRDNHVDRESRPHHNPPPSGTRPISDTRSTACVLASIDIVTGTARSDSLTGDAIRISRTIVSATAPLCVPMIAPTRTPLIRRPELTRRLRRGSTSDAAAIVASDLR